MKQDSSHYIAIDKSISNKRMELILFPTEQCNFRCTYCYEDFSIGRMSKDTIQGVKSLISNRAPELEWLRLSWFGGEPLVAKDIVYDISKHASDISKQHQFLYDGMMTTNGYSLNPNTVTSLQSVGVTHYQISLDGIGEIHNETRRRADGRGTFERIWGNLLHIRDSDYPITVMLRVHLDLDKLKHTNELIEELKTNFINDSRFIIDLKPIEKLGGKNDPSLKVIPLRERQQILNLLKDNLYGSGYKESLNTEPYICYAAKPNSLAIRADGNIVKCTVALQDERNNLGKLNNDGTININNNRLAPWVRGFSSLDWEALSCPLQNLPNLKEG